MLSDFPVGTAASFNVTFDDSGLVDDAAQVTDYAGAFTTWRELLACWLGRAEANRRGVPSVGD